MSYLTRLARKATGVPISTSDLPDGKKRAVKNGLDVAVAEVVAVPFGTLPGDFGIQPLESKSAPQEGLKVSGEAAADKLSKVGGEVPPGEGSGKDAPVVVAPGEEALKLSGTEAAADKAHLEGSGKVDPAVVALGEETLIVSGKELGADKAHLGKGVKVVPAVVALVEEMFKDAPVVVAPGEEALKLSGKEAAADKAHLEGSGKVDPAVVVPVEETFKDAPAAVAPVEETLILSGKEAGADKAHLGKVGKEKVPPGEGSGKNKSKAAASGVTEKKKKGKEAGKRRRDDKKLVDVDTSKNNKNVRGRKSDKDVALKETVDVDDGVHIRKKMSCLSSFCYRDSY
jgi:hypothetical protein